MTRNLVVMLVALAIWFLPLTAAALDIEDEVRLDRPESDGLTGLLMNRTGSIPGHEFFRVFSSFWYPPETSNDYNIFITDRKHPHLGTWAFVVVNDQVVHRIRLSTRTWEVEEVAKDAIRPVFRYVVRTFGSDSVDAFAEDLAGDGF